MTTTDHPRPSLSAVTPAPARDPEPDRPRCRWHGYACAYPIPDPARCCACHASWSVILSTGWHSCEHPSVWPQSCPGGRRRALSRLARIWRLDAARQRPASHATTPHPGDGSPAPGPPATRTPDRPTVHGTEARP